MRFWVFGLILIFLIGFVGLSSTHSRRNESKPIASFDGISFNNRIREVLKSRATDPSFMKCRIDFSKRLGKWFYNNIALFRNGDWVLLDYGRIKGKYYQHDYGFGHCSDGRTITIREDSFSFQWFIENASQPDSINHFVILSSGSLLIE